METVTQCIKLKDWTNKEGKVVPIYKVDLSDGRSGESFANEIPVGTPLNEIIVEPGQYGNKFKWTKAKPNGFAKQPKGNESFALSYAKDIYIAHLGVIGKEMDSTKMFAVADLMFNWLESKKK